MQALVRTIGSPEMSGVDWIVIPYTGRLTQAKRDTLARALLASAFIRQRVPVEHQTIDRALKTLDTMDRYTDLELVPDGDRWVLRSATARFTCRNSQLHVIKY